MQKIFAQGEDPFPPSHSNLTQEQRTAREHLLKQEGFTVNVLATNISRPYNILYGPDDALSITEREGRTLYELTQ